MIKRPFIIFFVVSAILVSACVKESYDMNKLSGKGHFSPTFVMAAVKGDVAFSDLVKAGDTLVFDENKFVKIIYREDSVINVGLKDFFDLDDMVSFSQSYQLGILSLGSFKGSLAVSLNQISQQLQTPLMNEIRALDDGDTHIFPPVPSVNIGERTFSTFAGFDYAVFHSGYLEMSVTNNLSTPLSGFNINLLNGTDRSVIGFFTIPALLPGDTRVSSVDLAGKMVSNTIIADIELQGSEGTEDPVIISLDNSNIQLEVAGKDLKITSGRIILPQQNISTLDNQDTITFDPGYGIELDEISIADGVLNYHVQSGTMLEVSLKLTLPSVRRGGSVFTHTINTGTGASFDGSVNFDNTIIDLGSDPAHPYNSMPLEYELSVGSDNIMINYNSSDKIEVDLNLANPEFGYLKGYFGQHSESVDPYTLDLDIDDFLSHMTGDFLISSPSITLDYTNSFAIPIEVDFQVTGRRGTESVELGLDTIVIASPLYPDLDVSSSIVIDKNNSALPELISLPPGNLVFSGTAIMNPSVNDGLRNNYIYGESRFLASAELELPMEFRMNNLQFTDTLDNFLKEDEETDNPIKPENFELLQLDLIAKNGFPLGISVKMSLYDEDTETIKSTIDASSLLGPAPVDANGRANGVKETTTSLKLTKDFFDAVKSSEKIIVWFTLNTTSSMEGDVKIYSDYRIDFKAIVKVKPEIIFN